VNVSRGVQGYLAGLIDADGSIAVSRRKDPNGSYVYSLRLTITNTDGGLIQWLFETFGGHTFKRVRSEKYAKRWKPEHRWGCAGFHAANLLALCVPYMICKKERALLGLEFASTLQGRGKRLTEQTLEHRQRLYLAMRAENQRGKS